MTTTTQKNDIVELLKAEKNRLGSFSKVAKKVGVSEATISLMVNQNWNDITEEMWMRVASAIGYRPEGWQVVQTTNTGIVTYTAMRAKKDSLFMAISHKAGSGKTASLRAYEATNKQNHVFYLSCREWAKREFLLNLAKNLGIDGGNKAISVDGLLMAVVEFFKVRRAYRPLLILDEADKLKSAAFRTLITLYNECEDQVGVLIAGTDHLEKQMNSDAKYNRKGADEIVSRFGRNYIHLVGATLKDVEAIATANGITSAATIKAIYQECEPVKRIIALESGQKVVEVVEDLRRVKRAIQRELGLLANAAA